MSLLQRFSRVMVTHSPASKPATHTCLTSLRSLLRLQATPPIYFPLTAPATLIQISWTLAAHPKPVPRSLTLRFAHNTFLLPPVSGTAPLSPLLTVSGLFTSTPKMTTFPPLRPTPLRSTMQRRKVKRPNFSVIPPRTRCTNSKIIARS